MSSHRLALCRRSRPRPYSYSDNHQKAAFACRSNHSKYTHSLEGLRFRCHLRGLSVQRFGSFLQLAGRRRIPGQVGFHTCRPVGGRVDSLRALVRRQIVTVFALLKRVNFNRWPIEGPFVLLCSIAMPPQASATDDGNHLHRGLCNAEPTLQIIVLLFTVSPRLPLCTSPESKDNVGRDPSSD